MKITAIIPAAGSGKRMGGRIKKQFLSLNELPILVRSVQAIQKSCWIQEIILVVGEEEISLVEAWVKEYHLHKVVAVVLGGKERQDSVWSGLQRVRQADYILVHDGVRPFVEEQLITDLMEAVVTYGAAGAAVPVTDTIKIVHPGQGVVEETLSRDRLWAMQTPQVFSWDLLLKAYRHARTLGIVGTDDASLAELVGAKVKIVYGSYNNIKITTPRDLLLGQLIMGEGIGCE